GVSSRSSHSWPAGRITFSAKSWTHFWICSWSSFSSREKLSAIPVRLPSGRNKLLNGNNFPVLWLLIHESGRLHRRGRFGGRRQARAPTGSSRRDHRRRALRHLR